MNNVFSHFSAARFLIGFGWLLALCPAASDGASVHSMRIYASVPPPPPRPRAVPYLLAFEPIPLRFAAALPLPGPRPVYPPGSSSSDDPIKAKPLADQAAAPEERVSAPPPTPAPGPEPAPASINPKPDASTNGTVAPAVAPPASTGDPLSIIPDDTPRAVRPEDLVPYFQLPTGQPASSATYKQL